MTDQSRKALAELVWWLDVRDQVIAQRLADWTINDDSYKNALANARAVLATAPAEPPKDGEVAALIERLRAVHAPLMSVAPFGFNMVATMQLCGEAAEALARLSAPVPARECQHDWKPRWQQSLGEGETRWIECELCGAKRFPPPAADK